MASEDQEIQDILRGNRLQLAAQDRVIARLHRVQRELLTALRMCRDTVLPSADSLPFTTETAIGHVVRAVNEAINKAEGKVE
jgi:hypothetical protein